MNCKLMNLLTKVLRKKDKKMLLILTHPLQWLKPKRGKMEMQRIRRKKKTRIQRSLKSHPKAKRTRTPKAPKRKPLKGLVFTVE